MPADTLAGRYRPFADYLAAAVRRRLALAGHASDAAVDDAVTAAGCLPAYPEAGRALAALADAGLRVATITNSPTVTAERALTASGLRQRFDHVIGSDTCQAYKPSRIVYDNGLRRIGGAPAEVCMVAAHGWDLLGAHQAGMRTAWISRGERIRLDTVPQPDVIGNNLFDTVTAIIDANGPV